MDVHSTITQSKDQLSSFLFSSPFAQLNSRVLYNVQYPLFYIPICRLLARLANRVLSLV